MVDTGIFCTTQEVQDHVGANANSTVNAEAYINRFVAEAESFINVTAKYNFSDNYAALNADVKKMLSECAACLAAMKVIQYDMSGFAQLNEAQTRLNVLSDRAGACLSLLKEKDKVFYINGA